MSSYPAYDPRVAHSSPAGPPDTTLKPAGYPPPIEAHNSFNQSSDKMNYAAPDVRVDIRQISRTPSPTPSEAAELKKAGLFDWKAMASWRYWFRRDWLWYYIIGAIVLALTIAFTVFHKQIVTWLQPAANWMHDLPGGWAIPIGILFVISFPPLFGHEIVAILCGVVWGLWVGFAIVSAGTFLGEIGNFYAFRYCCSARGEKLEKTQLKYACLARVVREGGFKIALIARFSAIPGHFTTAVFSTCGMNIWVFSIAAVLSLPKQFLTVYLGVALEQSEDGQTSRTDKIIKAIVISVTAIVTIGAMWYIYNLMNKAKHAVIYERRKARQAKLESAGSSSPYILETANTVPYNVRESDPELPLTANFNSSFNQQWDGQGRAVGYAPDPSLYAPQPRRPVHVSAPQSPSGSGAPGPAMRERAPPLRQNTDSSAGSWDVQGHIGPNAYPMSQPQYRDPYANSQPAKLPPPPPPQQPYTPNTSAARTYGAASPVGTTSAGQTPTQARFASPGPMSYALPPPGSYGPGAYVPPSFTGASVPPSYSSHQVEASDASFYTARGQHSRTPTEDPYTAYAQPHEMRR